MAKKKQEEVAAAPLALASTAELLGDGANPRKISEESQAGLRASIKRFGDLSGIVFNRRTGELVAGHQRIEQIRAEYGDRDVEPIDEAAGLFGIRIDEGHYFPVRVVDWTPAKQRAANVAANNPKIQGAFTKELSTYLLSVEAELAEEMPGVLDDCLMVQLMSAGLDTSDASEGGKEIAISESYQIIVQCNDEEHQSKLYEQFTGEGLSCKVLTL
jgi:hypothetical protein